MSKINFRCPSCNTKISVDVGEAGRCMKCSKCRIDIVIPLLEPTGTSAAEESHRQKEMQPVVQALPPEKEPFDPKYVGIRGWLFLFCLILLVLNPAMVGISTLYLGRVISRNPAIKENMPLYITFIFHILFGAAYFCFSLYAGISLWKVKPNAVRIAKNFLLFSIFISIADFLPTLAFDLPAEKKAQFLRNLTDGFFTTLIFVFIWYSYLVRSKRVKATYGQSDD